MLTIDVIVKPSRIHGLGLFAVRDIKKSTVLYYFNGQAGDRVTPISSATKEEIHFGYSCNPYLLSICGDNARYWNFSNSEDVANCAVSDILLNGEPLIYASVDIPAGAELLVPPSSDLTYGLKMDNG